MADKNDTTEGCPTSPEQIDESQLEGKTPLELVPGSPVDTFRA